MGSRENDKSQSCSQSGQGREECKGEGAEKRGRDRGGRRRTKEFGEEGCWLELRKSEKKEREKRREGKKSEEVIFVGARTSGIKAKGNAEGQR